VALLGLPLLLAANARVRRRPGAGELIRRFNAGEAAAPPPPARPGGEPWVQCIFRP
jgi:hypothetical protein